MSLGKDGIVVVLSSPSGAGKTTLVKKIAQENNFKISISYTTRKPRTNEVNGKDYFFISEKEFKNLIKNNEFLEYAKVFDYYYGTRKQPVTDKLIKGKDVLFDIDWQGTQQLKKNTTLSLLTFFILPPNKNVLKQRLLNRHEGQEKVINERMSKFSEEVSHWNEYNYIVINDDLNACYNEISNIITAEKKGLSQKQNLSEVKKKIEELTK